MTNDVLNFQDLIDAGVEIFGLPCVHKVTNVEGISGGKTSFDKCQFVSRESNGLWNMSESLLINLYLREGNGIFCIDGVWYKTRKLTGRYWSNDGALYRGFVTLEGLYPPEKPKDAVGELLLVVEQVRRILTFLPPTKEIDSIYRKLIIADEAVREERKDQCLKTE